MRKNFFLSMCILVASMVLASGMNSVKSNVSTVDQTSVYELQAIMPDVYLASSNEVIVMPAILETGIVIGELRGDYLQVDKVSYENNKSLQELKHCFNHRENI